MDAYNDGITRPPSLPRMETRRGPRPETLDALDPPESRRSVVYPSLEVDAASGLYYRPPDVNFDVTLNAEPNVNVTLPGQNNTRGTIVREEVRYNSSFNISPSSIDSQNGLLLRSENKPQQKAEDLLSSARHEVYADPGPPRRTDPFTESDLQQHPNSGKDSPPCPDLLLKEHPVGPFPIQKARVRQNSDSSGDGSPPKQEDEPSGHQELVIGGETFDKKKRVFSYRNQDCFLPSVADCLATLADWRYEHIVTKQSLARARFVYKGPGDRVMCSRCGGALRGWEHGDDPRTEHKRLFKKDCY